MFLAPHDSLEVADLDLMAALSSKTDCGARSAGAGVRCEAMWRGLGRGSVGLWSGSGFGTTGVDFGAVRSGGERGSELGAVAVRWGWIG